MFPQLDVRRGVSFVHDGPMLTSQGGAKSYDVAMYLVAHLYGDEVAKRSGRGLVIDWPPATAPYRSWWWRHRTSIYDHPVGSASQRFRRPFPVCSASRGTRTGAETVKKINPLAAVRRRAQGHHGDDPARCPGAGLDVAAPGCRSSSCPPSRRRASRSAPATRRRRRRRSSADRPAARGLAGHDQRHRDDVGQRLGGSGSVNLTSSTAPTWTWPRSRCATASTAFATCCRTTSSASASGASRAPTSRCCAATQRRWPQETLYDFAENVVQRRLERLEGVAQVTIRGLQTPKLQIDLDPARLRPTASTCATWSTRFAPTTVNLSAGDIKEGSRKLLVRAVGEMSTSRRSAAAGQRRRLSAGRRRRGRYTFPQQEDFNFLNGVEALTVRVNKARPPTCSRSSTGSRPSSRRSRRCPRPQGSSSASTRTPRSTSARARAAAQRRPVGGGWRSWRSSSSCAAGARRCWSPWPSRSRWSSPSSDLLPAPGGPLDITLNVVSLAGLMLALGMLVDNSIVVIESIFRHRNELGEDADGGAQGHQRRRSADLASTATTLCVFLPIVFMGRRRLDADLLREHRHHGLHRHGGVAAGGADGGAAGGRLPAAHPGARPPG